MAKPGRTDPAKAELDRVEPGRHSRRARPARIRRLRNWSLSLIGLLALLSLAWLAATAVLAKSQLTKAKISLAHLQDDVDAQDFPSAQRHSAELAKYSKRAHELTTGPVWWASAAIPDLGAPVKTVRVSAAQVNQLATTALPAVIDIASRLDLQKLKTAEGFNLTTVIGAAPSVHLAYTAASRAEAALRALPAHTWLSPVDQARTTIIDRLDPLVRTLRGADRGTQLAPSMLGADGTRRYFVAFQNEAESRGLGGLPGAFGILTASNGSVKFSYFGNDTALDGMTAAPSSENADYLAKWKQADPTGLYINSNIGYSMADAAKIWASMWQRKTGQKIDGAVAVDPTALSYLLGASGPATLPGGEQVTSDTIVSLTEQQVYARFSDNPQRKAFLLSVARAVEEKLITAGNSSATLKAAFLAASQNRLQIWSSHPGEQKVLDETSFASGQNFTGKAVSGFTVVNAAGTKLDYYLDRSVVYERTGCGGAQMATSMITLTNNAPTTPLPAYVTTRLDSLAPSAKPGDNRLLVTYYATPGARAESVYLDGKPVASSVSTENGLLAVTVDVELAARSSRTMTVTVTEPDPKAATAFIKQPLVRPLALQATDRSRAACR